MNKNIIYAGTGHRPPRLNLDYSGEAVEKIAGFAQLVLTDTPRPDRINGLTIQNRLKRRLGW